MENENNLKNNSINLIDSKETLSNQFSRLVKENISEEKYNEIITNFIAQYLIKNLSESIKKEKEEKEYSNTIKRSLGYFLSRMQENKCLLNEENYNSLNRIFFQGKLENSFKKEDEIPTFTSTSSSIPTSTLVSTSSSTSVNNFEKININNLEYFEETLLEQLEKLLTKNISEEKYNEKIFSYVNQYLNSRNGYLNNSITNEINEKEIISANGKNHLLNLLFEMQSKNCFLNENCFNLLNSEFFQGDLENFGIFFKKENKITNDIIDIVNDPIISNSTSTLISISSSTSVNNFKEIKDLKDFFEKEKFDRLSEYEKIEFLKQQGIKISNLEYEGSKDEYNELFKYFYKSVEKLANTVEKLTNNQEQENILKYIRIFMDSISSAMSFNDYHLNDENFSNFKSFYIKYFSEDSFNRNGVLLMSKNTTNEKNELPIILEEKTPFESIENEPIDLLNEKGELIQLEKWNVYQILLDYRFWNAIDSGRKDINLLNFHCADYNKLTRQKTVINIIKKIFNPEDFYSVFERAKIVIKDEETLKEIIKKVSENEKEYNRAIIKVTKEKHTVLDPKTFLNKFFNEEKEIKLIHDEIDAGSHIDLLDSDNNIYKLKGMFLKDLIKDIRFWYTVDYISDNKNSFFSKSKKLNTIKKFKELFEGVDFTQFTFTECSKRKTKEIDVFRKIANSDSENRFLGRLEILGFGKGECETFLKKMEKNPEYYDGVIKNNKGIFASKKDILKQYMKEKGFCKNENESTGIFENIFGIIQGFTGINSSKKEEKIEIVKINDNKLSQNKEEIVIKDDDKESFAKKEQIKKEKNNNDMNIII